MKKRPVIGITGNERPFPDDPDANMSYAATGFVEAVKEAGGIPLDLARLEMQPWPKTTYR